MTNNITTYTGRSIDPLGHHVQLGDIDIIDIATALSRIPRFAGHTKHFYSVAQHSCMVAQRLRPELKLSGLLHDASEAYLLDIPTPIKQHLPIYYTAEKRIMNIILARFGLPNSPYQIDFYEIIEEIKLADKAQLQFEIQELMTPFLSNQMLPQDASPSLRCWTPDEAQFRFLELFNAIYTES
jgi:uncharacterized protein